MMTPEEDFIVEEPYIPTEEESKAIAVLKAKGFKPDDWKSRKKGINSFKENFREYMYGKQNKLCAFCRIHVPLACVPMHREHIVFKDKHPEWMFLPENLCIACPICNDFKGITEVLAHPRTTVYPTTSSGFKIIHPMYDRYSKHIELIGGILYHGLTKKGKFTINTCHLYRVELAEERVDQLKIEDNKESILAGLLKLLKQSEKYVDDNEKFKSSVTEIVNKYKLEQQM